MSKTLQVDVYCAPAISAETPYPNPDKKLWSPICCTLIQGPTSAVLVDTPTTTELARGLSDWVKKTAAGKELKYIYTTHAHGDHFLGNPVIAKDFPGVKCVATAFVVEGIKGALSEEGMGMWNTLFPDQVPEGQFVPEALPAGNEFRIDGHSFVGHDVEFSDTQNSSFLHVPDIGLVVAGDIVYGECNQHFGEANTTEKRKHWLNALDQIEALMPHIVVAGHKRPSQSDGPYLIEQTREYIYAFEEEVKKWKDADKLEQAMKERYPGRWNNFILAFSCQSTVGQLQNSQKASI